MAYSITKKQLSPQPALVVRRRVERSGIANAIGEALGRVGQYVQQNGIGIAGPPFARYPEMGGGLFTIDIGMPVIGPPGVPADPEIRVDHLPGGPAVVTTHMGPYDKLPEAFAAIQQWITANGLTATSAPWESYVTDPGNYPDPKDWKTEVFCPVNS